MKFCKNLKDSEKLLVIDCINSGKISENVVLIPGKFRKTYVKFVGEILNKFLKNLERVNVR